MSDSSPAPQSNSRRDFLKGSTAAIVGGAMLGSLSIARSAHAAGSETLKLGLIGCGGRGSGAAVNALHADPGVKLTAMADMFDDRLQTSLKSLNKSQGEIQGPEGRVDVPPERQFIGWDAYQKLLATDVDVVILATPPNFRPLHYKAAVAAGKHCFVEKPVAVDAPGVLSILETNKEAQRKNLIVVSGLCYRYDKAKRELIQRVHDGDIGDILTMHVSYNTATLKYAPRKPEWSDMEYQLRNWQYFNWTSGDFNVEQHVHSLDKASWAVNNAVPIKVSGLGGRQCRPPEEGNVFDHMACVYEFDNGVQLFSNCRQIDGCDNDVSDYLVGSKGTAEMMSHTIKGSKPWKFQGKWNLGNVYNYEHEELFAALRAGKNINNGDYMAKSTMIGIMGRMACYTGKILTWDECMASTENLMPDKLEFGPLPVAPVAMPGLTRFALSVSRPMALRKI